MSVFSLFHRLVPGLVALPLLAASPVLAQQSCYTAGAAQFVDAIHYCVSSVLAPQGRNSYGPENLADGNSTTAWCEGVSGPGIGETIILKIDNGAPFSRLLVRNGYGKSQKAYLDNGRPEMVEITTDQTPPSRVRLTDQNGILPVPLVASASYKWVQIRILSVYPGARYADTCMDFIGPDFEHEEELLWRRQLEAQNRPDVSAPAQPAPPATASRPPAPASTSCATAGTELTGVLTRQTTQNAAGDPVLVFLFELNRPGCIRLADGSRIGDVFHIQIIPKTFEDYVLLKTADESRTLRVSGRFEPASLAWHLEKVLLTAPDLTPAD